MICRCLRRLLLAGLVATPPAAAAVWAWWTRGTPTPGDAATWRATHTGDLDATGLYAREVEANLRRLKEQQR